jgi:hypothetical protein
VCADDEVRARFSGADEGEALLAIRFEIALRIPLVHPPLDDPDGAGEAPALEAAIGKVESRLEPGIEDVPVAIHFQSAGSSSGEFEGYPVAGPSLAHSRDRELVLPFGIRLMIIVHHFS